jgi:hypothetical protein
MKLTKINYFFNTIENKENKYYNFNKNEHELVLLKKLDDNKIFYNNTIYEKDFFYYHKLEAFIQKIYDLRTEFIQREFMAYLTIVQDSAKFAKAPLIKFFDFNLTNFDEVNDLTYDQYKVLIKAYKYEFEYDPKFDLLDLEKEYDSTNKPIIKDLFEDWFYIVGWKSIKPIQPIFSPSLHAHYEDDNVENREENIFRNTYSPLEECMRFKLEWIEEYDEQKKFDEFNIYCKTNSYHTRYIPYNEIYNKDYPEEKKFKTDLIHDFTEEEIQENYENMINKDKLAKDKWEFVLLDERRRTAVFKFFEELEIIEVTEERYVYPQNNWYDCWFYEEQDSDFWTAKRVEKLIHEVLNNPRYLLVMPLVDAYFEVFRSKGWYDEDESFVQWYPVLHCKKLLKQLMYYNFSYERQYMFAKNIWLTQDFYFIDDDDLEEHLEEEWYAAGLSLILGSWFLFLNLYLVIYWFSDLNIPWNSPSFLPKYYNSLKTVIFTERSETAFRKLFCPEVYYGIELRRPRSRIRVINPNHRYLPAKFYDDTYYSYSKKNARSMLPYSILDKLSRDLDEKDYGLENLHREIFYFGRRHLIFNLTVPFVESPHYDEFRKPITLHGKITGFINKHLFMPFIDKLGKFVEFVRETYSEFKKK